MEEPLDGPIMTERRARPASGGTDVSLPLRASTLALALVLSACEPAPPTPEAVAEAFPRSADRQIERARARGIDEGSLMMAELALLSRSTMQVDRLACGEPDDEGARVCRFALVQLLPRGGEHVFEGDEEGLVEARLVPDAEGWLVEAPGVFLGPLPELGDAPREAS